MNLKLIGINYCFVLIFLHSQTCKLEHHENFPPGCSFAFETVTLITIFFAPPNQENLYSYDITPSMISKKKKMHQSESFTIMSRVPAGIQPI